MALAETAKPNIDADFLNPKSDLRPFPISAKDTLKKIIFSDLGPTFSCWEAHSGLAWSANANKLPVNRMTEPFLRFR